MALIGSRIVCILAGIRSAEQERKLEAQATFKRIRAPTKHGQGAVTFHI